MSFLRLELSAFCFILVALNYIPRLWGIILNCSPSVNGYPVAATSAVCVFAAARRTTHSLDCWRPSIHCCRFDALEQSATRRYWLCVTDVILPETENFFCFLYHFHDCIFFLVVLEVFTWATLKISYVCICVIFVYYWSTDCRHTQYSM